MKYIKDVIQDNFRGIQEEFNLHIKKAHYVILCWLVEFKFKKKKKKKGRTMVQEKLTRTINSSTFPG